MQSRLLLAALLSIAAASCAQTTPASSWTTEQDHQNMMDQLGIKSVRPGPSGNESDPNHANYDEAKAYPYSDPPQLLVSNSGRQITSADQWWKLRRPELVELFSREIYGFIPPNVPRVSWHVTSTENQTLGSTAVLERHLIGHVDNSAYPQLTVDIEALLVTPAATKSRVPVLIMYGSLGPPKFKMPPGVNGTSNDPPAREQLVADGWGFVTLDTASIQADNGAGLRSGIIGLTNKGQPRTPEQWGALRAWGWGASRVLDYLETDPAIDAKHVGIEGVSRWGKAALVTEAFDTRFAMGLIGSSGEGGAKLHRHFFGESVESITGGGEYHWMAGNFLKYGASESTFGAKTASDLPVDAHELIALCAPRLVFLSYGIPAHGDANWIDQQGNFESASLAEPVYQLLKAKPLGSATISPVADYRTAKMPPVNNGLLDGRLAWRQHDGGHTDAPNVKYFIQWADRFIGHSVSTP